MPTLPDLDKLSCAELEKLIIKIVYERLKPLGFRKHGKTLHRFVDGDISQVVYFDRGYRRADLLLIYLGIRVPECDLMKFIISEQTEEYYHFGRCNLRSALLRDANEDSHNIFFLFQKTGLQPLIDKIIDKLENEVIPAFEVLSNRDNIINCKEKYSYFYYHKHLIRLHESMIWGRRGNLDEAAKLFKSYYQDSLAKYNDEYENGYQKYLYKGDTVTYRNFKTKKDEKVIATHDGYYTIYGANRGHVDYLEELAKELGIDLNE